MNPSRSILFLPQNSDQFENMIGVAARLEVSGFAPVFLDAGAIYHEPILPDGFKYRTLDAGFRPEKPFYLLPLSAKWSVIRRFVRAARAWTESFSAVIIGNDGAIQRALLSRYRNIPKFMILDGIITNTNPPWQGIFRFRRIDWHGLAEWLHFRFRAVLASILRFLPWGYYLPSLIGASRPDLVFVMNAFSERSMRAFGVPDTSLRKYGMPRFEKFLPVPGKTSSVGGFLLLVTQGYEWHGEFANEKCQALEIARFLAALRALESMGIKLRLKIRVHPRDDAAKYRCLTVPDRIELSQSSLLEDLDGASAVFGFNSTVLVQAKMMLKPVYVLMTHGQYARFSNDFISSPDFVKIFDALSLQKVLDGMSAGKFENIPVRDSESFVPPTVGEASGLIARDVLERLKPE